ncbi:MAG: hypothetical protein IV085_06255 [Thiobacillus sp.]|nr:hypothetical protein [Thiobacillus sp.]
MPGFAFLAVAAATAFLFVPVRQQAGRLLYRTRWLMGVLLLAYAYSLPGDALWPALGWASPSGQGLLYGGWRVARLVLMLVGLAVLLAYTPRPRLIFGLYFLAVPLGWLGLDRRAFAVRLGLTLDYVEQAPQPVRWLDALRAPEADNSGPAFYVFQREQWQGRDTAVILVGLLGLWAVLV